MATITIASTVVPNVNYVGTTITLRIFSDRSWAALDGTIVPARGNDNTFYKEYTVSLSVPNATIPQVVLLSQTDAPNEKNARYSAYFYVDGVEKDMLLANTLGAFQVPDTPASTTWSALEQYNFGTNRRYYKDEGTYSALVIDQKIAAVTGTTDLTTSTFAGLPTAGTAGRQRLLTDRDEGLYIDSGSQWYSATNGIYNVKRFGAKGDGSTDDTTVIQSAITAAYNNGGGTVYFPPATYRLSGQLVIPNDGAGRPNQPAIRLEGVSSSGNGAGDAPLGGSILDMRFTGTPAKIDTRGDGQLTLANLSFKDGGSTSSTPFIQTTNTSIHILFCMFYGNTATNPTQDAIVCGGTGTTSDGGINAPYQGYHSLIFGCYFNRIQRALYGRTYANGIFFLCNTIWNGSGGNAAVEFLPVVSNSDSGNTVEHNIIEMTNYVYGVRLRNQSIGNRLGPNNFYDEGVGTLALYRIESGATFNKIIAGTHSDVPLFVDDQNAPDANDVDNFHQSQYSTHTQPVQFRSTLKSVGDNIGIIHEDASGNQWLQTISPSTFGHPFDFFYQASGGSPEAALELYRASATDKRVYGGGSSRFSIIASGGDIYLQAASGKITYIGTSALETVLQIAAAGTVSALPIQAQLFKVAGTQVVGAQVTGWTAPTGTISRGTFNTATVTTEELAKRVYGIIADLLAHGLIGP